MFVYLSCFFCRCSKEAYTTGSNFVRPPFWSARKALWVNDVRWLLSLVAWTHYRHILVLGIEKRSYDIELKASSKKHTWFFPPLFTLSARKVVLSMNIVSFRVFQLNWQTYLYYRDFFFLCCVQQKEQKKYNSKSRIFTTLDLKTILKLDEHMPKKL